jgi:hypothetical protein
MFLTFTYLNYMPNQIVPPEITLLGFISNRGWIIKYNEPEKEVHLHSAQKKSSKQ